MLLGRNKSSIGTQSNRSSTVCVAQVTWLSTCCYSSSSLASSALATKRPYDYMTIISRTTYLRVRRSVATLPSLNNSRMSSLYHHFTPASNAANSTDGLADRPTNPSTEEHFNFQLRISHPGLLYYHIACACGRAIASFHFPRIAFNESNHGA